MQWVCITSCAASHQHSNHISFFNDGYLSGKSPGTVVAHSIEPLSLGGRNNTLSKIRVSIVIIYVMCLYMPSRHAMTNEIYDLEPQFGVGDFYGRLSAKILRAAGLSPVEFQARALEWFYTATWVLGRLPSIATLTDVLAICDYVTRIHFGKPVGSMIFEFAFSSGLEAQTLDWSVLKDLTTAYDTLKTHPAVIKFIKVVGLAFSGGFLKSIGYESSLADLWEMLSECMTRVVGHSDFFIALFDLLRFVGERIAAFCATGSWRVLLHTPTSYQRWVDDSHDILDKSVGLSNPEALGYDYHTYVSQLVDLIQQGEEIKRFIRAADARDGVSHVLSRLRTLHNEILITQACGKFRMAPFSMLISAGSGAGKSSFMTTLIVHFAKLYNKPLGDRYVYFRTPGEKHWNCFKTTCWVVCIDDVAFVNPNTGSEDPSLTDILLGIGNSAYSPPQASLEDKGKTPFMCDLFICSTNTEDLKAHCWFNNPQAVRRRFPYIVNIIPKEEYRRPGTQMLDPSKVVVSPGEYPDLWHIVVKEVRVLKDERISTPVVLETDSIYEFISNYNQWCDDHRRSQTAFLRSKTNSEEVKLCPSHLVPFIGCGCVDASLSSLEPQALQTPLRKQVCLKHLVLTGLALVCGYQATKFTARCASEVLNNDPAVISSPSSFIWRTANRGAQKVQWYCAEKKRQLRNFTRDQLKQVLVSGLHGMYESYSPALKNMVLISGALVSLGLTWHYFKREAPELFPQVSIDEVGIVPTPKQEKENVWRKDDYVPSEFLGRLSTAWAGLSLSKACSVMSRNVVWCQTVHSGTKCSVFRALCLSGHLYVVPHHVLPSAEYFEMQVIHENNAEGCNGNIRFKMSQAMIYRCPESELAFFEINHMPGRRDISGILPQRGVRFDAPGRMVVRQSDGSIQYSNSVRSTLMQAQEISQFNITLDICNSYFDRDTVKGECGAVVLVQMPGATLLGGLHVLGGERHQGVAVPVYQHHYEAALKWFDTPTVENSVPFLEGQGFSSQISPKCTARFVQDGTLQVFGSFTGFKRQPKSTATNTLFTEELVKDGREVKYGPAPMKGFWPLRLGLLDIVQSKRLFKEDVLRHCTYSFANEVCDGLTPEDLSELKPLTLKCALNGYPGVRFIDSMNFNTSAGYPHNKSKRFLISRVPADEIHQHPVVLSDEIKQEVEEVWNKMVEGVSSAPIFMQHLKDEALPLDKIQKGKCRIFMGGPFAWSICVRMALLPFIRLMQMNKYLFECAPGTNATSIEWTRIYQYVTRFGTDRMIAGDFKAFDKVMGSLVIMEAFRFIQIVLRRANVPEEQHRAVQVIAEDVAFAFVNFNGDLMRFFGMNPSGHPLTVIINCIVNSLYMRYCYIELNPKGEVDTFRENVALITYGDDNLAGSAVDWFNHTAISQVLADVGIVYTMADKGALSVPFLPITEVSFLKRYFRFEAELDAYMAVLEEDSIWKSLMICVPSSEVSMQKQCIEIVASAVCEWFFYGRERFEKERTYLIDLVSRCGLVVYVEKSTFPTWETLVGRFVLASEDYLHDEPSSSKHILGEMVWNVPTGI